MKFSILEGAQRLCFQARTTRVNFYVDHTTNPPSVSYQDIVVRQSAIANVWTCEITKDLDTILFITPQYVVNGNISTTQSAQNIIQTEMPVFSNNLFLAGQGRGMSTRFKYCMNNQAAGTLTPITTGVYFELVMQNSSFGY